MSTSRNFVTIALLIGVGALGWAGGSHFSAGGDAHSERTQGQATQTADAHAAKAGGDDGHGHAGGKSPEGAHGADDGHGHGKPAAVEAGAYCAEHRLPEAEDVLCNPGLMTALLPGEGIKMRLATPEAAARAGITIAAAKKTGIAGGPSIPAQVTYNRARLAEVMALSGGTVRRIAAEPGQSVARGALLAEIASPAAAVARGDYQGALGRLQLAEANVAREQELVARGVSARMELEQALAEEQAARATVEQLREQLDAFGARTSGGGVLSVRAPLGGTVVARSAVAGQTLAPETPLFTVADLSSMWLAMQVSAAQMGMARAGAPIEAEFDNLPGQLFPGKIVQVDAGLDERTRLLKVTAEIANPGGLLKDGMFGTARLAAAAADGNPAEEPAMTVTVPAAAVQVIDGKAYIFAAIEQDLFELRRVEAGPRRGGEVLVLAGLKDGEKVAASQGFALKSELLKSRLGASCADH